MIESQKLNRTKLPALLQHCGPCLQLHACTPVPPLLQHGSAALLPPATRPAASRAGVLSSGWVVHGRKRSAGRCSHAPGRLPLAGASLRPQSPAAGLTRRAPPPSLRARCTAMGMVGWMDWDRVCSVHSSAIGLGPCARDLEWAAIFYYWPNSTRSHLQPPAP